MKFSLKASYLALVFLIGCFSQNETQPTQQQNISVTTPKKAATSTQSPFIFDEGLLDDDSKYLNQGL